LARKEWLKDRLTYLEMWRDVKESQKANPEEWEREVRETFIAQAESCLATIGQERPGDGEGGEGHPKAPKALEAELGNPRKQP